MTKITELALKKLPPGSRITDDAIEGFIARCLPSGKVTFGYQYTDKATGQRRWMGIGMHGAVTVDQARTLAKKYAGQVAGRQDPATEHKVKVARSTNTVDYVLDQYLEHHTTLRTAIEIKKCLERHVRRPLGKIVIYDLERGQIMRLVDELAKKFPRAAHITLAHLRAAFNWWQLRDERFHTPIVRGMVRDKQVRRARVLSADELADLWQALDEVQHVPASFPAFVKVLLLTACRRCEVADMHTREIDGNKWTIPAARYKTGIDHVVPLVPAIKKLLPKTFGYIFGCACHKHRQAAGEKPLSGFGLPKEELDAAVAKVRRRRGAPEMPPWTFHDLRRTARTMMSELGIDRDTAEACLGHTKGGIIEVYDQYNRMVEKTAALEKLALHVTGITKPRAPAPATKLRLVAR
jgi:integrase